MDDISYWRGRILDRVYTSDKFVNLGRSTGFCWLWGGCKNSKGYGQIRMPKPRLMAGVHRVSYTAFKGEIPDGLVVRHTCDTPACVNPRHLLLGTQADNVKDSVDRGVHSGGGGRKAIISEDHFQPMLRLYELGYTQKQLASVFGVSRSTISSTLQRRLGSLADNNRDTQLDRKGYVKLSRTQVDEIRCLVACGEKQTRVAELFGISQTHVSDLYRKNIRLRS